MHNRSMRRWLACSAAAGVLALAAAPAHADQGAAYSFNQPSQPLADAVQAVGHQTGTNVLVDPRLVDGVKAPALKGQMTSAEAFQLLLASTDLVVQPTDKNSVLIRRKVAADPQSGSAGDGADTNVVQELVVTAQKKSENIQVVPIAISAFSQQDLTTRQITGGPDLMTQVPNMTFTKTNFTGYSIQIRGIGTQAISATTDAAVAVAFNNTPFIRNRFFEQEFYDLERVEVLRGPQGTLYGRNATAGVVNILSAKPKFDYEAKLSGDIANYGSKRVEGMINVPLVEDKVALRIAGAWTKRDGFVQNQITGNPIDGRDLWSTRTSLRFTPTDKLNVNLIWEHFQENDDRIRSGKQLCHQDARTEIGPADNRKTIEWLGWGNTINQGCLPASLYAPESFQAPNGFSLPYYEPLKEAGVPVIANFDPYASLTQSRDLRVIESTVDPKYQAKNDLVELQWSYELNDNLTLSSETSYLYDTIYSMEDFNRFNTRSGAFGGQAQSNFRDDILHVNAAGNWEFCDPQIGCADRLVAIDVSSAKSSQFSQEFRLSSDFGGPFNFSVGANYLRYDTEDKYYVFINTLTMMSAINIFGIVDIGRFPPWQQNGSDGLECYSHGQRLPDPSGYSTLAGCSYIDPNPLESVNDLGHNYFLSRNPYKLMSYAVFGEAYWNITDDLKLTAGLRMTRDEKQAPRIPSQLTGTSSVGLAVQSVENQAWTEPTGRLAIDWKPDLAFTDSTLLYASYSQGYKAGGSNPPPAGVVVWGGIGSAGATAKVAESVAKPKTFNPEFVNAFEVGAKNTLLDGALTANLAAFYYDYTGYQVSQIIDRSAVNYNFDAKIWGLELEADWRVAKNFRLGFKGGYEHTKIAQGEKAIDIMDRTAGHDDWAVVRPYPTFPSNCVLPLYVLDPENDGVAVGGGSAGGGAGPCEYAYTLHIDPVITPTVYTNSDLPAPPDPVGLPNYPGFNGYHDYGANNGEGFFKQLGGNELPNAPHFTATITADYTLPLPHDWLATLHADLYYQSEAWARVFNTPGYDRLKAYSNINVAAIFTNDAAGWKVMAYVKNVLDRDNITGAFLNSDDTGLTTNVFLNEPRLYGLRVTKDFSGGPWWTGSRPGSKGPFPLWIELGGAVLHQDAPYQSLGGEEFDLFSKKLDPTRAQHEALDWGDQREIRVTYKPGGGDLSLRAEFRYGDGNNSLTRIHESEVAGPERCGFVGYGEYFCDVGAVPRNAGTNWSDSAARQKEEHTLVDFQVGKDVGVGAIADSRSTLGVGLRYGAFVSKSNAFLDGVPNLDLPEGFFKYNATYDRYQASIDTKRKFTGVGPVLSWEAAKRLLGNDDLGHVDVDWAIAGGALFGREKTRVAETDAEFHFNGLIPDYLDADVIRILPKTSTSWTRSKKATVPFVDLSVGLSYQIQRIKIGGGYRWERYFDAVDAGYAERKTYDRTIDGPYFKVSIGFGG